MAWFNETDPDKLNVVLVGASYSGSGLLREGLIQHPKIICHGDLLHSDINVRNTLHSAYFGPSKKVPDYFSAEHISPEHYLNNKIFDNALHGERVVGVKLSYHAIIEHDLWEFLDQKSRQGDFSGLHVKRNPVASFVSKLQRETAETTDYNRPVYIDVGELTQHCRATEATSRKINRLFSDRAVVSYAELQTSFNKTMASIFSYLELPPQAVTLPKKFQSKRKLIQARIANWTQLKTTAPADVKEFLCDPSIY